MDVNTAIRYTEPVLSELEDSDIMEFCARLIRAREPGEDDWIIFIQELKTSHYERLKASIKINDGD